MARSLQSVLKKPYSWRPIVPFPRLLPLLALLLVGLRLSLPVAIGTTRCCIRQSEPMLGTHDQIPTRSSTDISQSRRQQENHPPDRRPPWRSRPELGVEGCGFYIFLWCVRELVLDHWGLRWLVPRAPGVAPSQPWPLRLGLSLRRGLDSWQLSVRPLLVCRHHHLLWPELALLPFLAFPFLLGRCSAC